MRYVVVSAFFVITLAVLVWMSRDSNPLNEQLSYGDCSNTTEEISKSHREYLLSYGWHIKSICNSSKEFVHYYPESIESMQIGGLNLEPYNNSGKEATKTTYVLKEKQKNGDRLSVTIYEIDGKLIGGYGILDNWDPGIFSLSEKDRLIEEGIISGKKS